jgi:hypothetical protein
MQEDSYPHIVELAFRLLSEANLSLGFFQGTGLGAVLLAVIAVALIRSPSFAKSRLTNLVRAWRSSK